jgi:hypothetical protein
MSEIIVGGNSRWQNMHRTQRESHKDYTGFSGDEQCACASRKRVVRKNMGKFWDSTLLKREGSLKMKNVG